jgi:hypothetical protein
MCRICNYNMVKTIDRQLLAGVTPAELSRKFAFTVAELEAHHRHLQTKMARVQKRFHHHLHLGLYCKLNNVMEMLLRVIRKTQAGDDVKSCLQAGREFTRIITLMDKMAVRLDVDPEFIYCLLNNPEWDHQEDSHLPYAYQALAESRQTLKQDLFDPCCPEPEPEPAPSLPLNPEPTRPAPPASPRVNLNAPPAQPHSGPLPEAAILAGQKSQEPANGKHARI